METKIKLIVIDGHTLGYTIPGSDYAGVLHASVLNGATSASPLSSLNPVFLMGKSVRLATEKDFNNFGVSFDGYKNDSEYIYAN